MRKRCPYCNKIAIFNEYVYTTCAAYLETNNAVTECCGKIVTVSPHVEFELYQYEGEETIDSWGVPCNPDNSNCIS